MTHQLRTTAGSHERFLVIEVFGRYDMPMASRGEHGKGRLKKYKIVKYF